jgi:hypothetical protein
VAVMVVPVIVPAIVRLFVVDVGVGRLHRAHARKVLQVPKR